MEFTGNIIGVSRDWNTNQLQITFSVNEPETVNEVNTLKECDKLTVKATKYRKKRSLDANAYAWTLISKLAESMKPPVPKEEVYELMLQRYGTNEVNEDGSVVMFSLLANIEVKLLHLHCACVGQGHVGDKLFNHYRLIKGSSEYNTQEMSVLIDGIVSECKEVGIETMTPAELEQMKQAWKGGTK